MASNSSTNSSLPSTLFAPIQGSTTEQPGFVLAWVVYCHTGSWSTGQLLRVLVSFQGLIKIILRPIFLRRWDLAPSLFACYLMGRTRINWRRGVVACFWLSIDTAALLMELILGGTDANRVAPLNILAAIFEGLLVVSIRFAVWDAERA